MAKKTFQKLSKEKQNTIFDGAAACFAEKGYYGASIKDICENADISNGALYKYFDNKEELFLEVLLRCQEILEEELYKKYTHIENSLKQTVEAYLNQIIKLHQKYPDYIKIYSNLGSFEADLLSDKLNQPFMESADYVYNMVQEAREKGEIKLVIDDKELSFLLDNYFILFLNSLISNYHEIRFRFFLHKKPEEALTNQDKINFILQSITPILK
ncbi:TetR/AcrR family transcriptional regulator [Oceanobacillus sojae]|uniref:TetR/AcrR family transcriptional regulator n=1 Tax=Oceanobacillus sojae TaxID=582851 RepID=UPI0021A90B2A|nr:TetR/AcrR family transcriptional regulator [Oceanobacillus sojae]MCT1903068.1 TetR/AcrR family transcriptional regulator [Oceanobacillus sojae]